MSTLPKGWARTTLEDLVRPKSERVSPTTQPDSPYIGLEHVQPHTNVILGTVPASSMTSSSASFDAGDILYGRMRPYLNKVVRPTFSGLASAEFIILPKSEAVEPSFLLKRISSIDFVEFACSQYEGDRPRVKFDALGKFQIDLPPISEQVRIVTKLEALLTDLDMGVAELQTAQNKLAQYRQSLLKAAVEGVLTAQWREDNPAAENGAQLLERILQERRVRWETKQLAKFAEQGKKPPKGWQKKYPEPVQPDTANLPPLPEGWVWASLDMIGEIASGVAKGSKRANNLAVREVPYLRVANVQRGYLDLSEVKTILATEQDITELALQDGDVLFNEGGDRDKLGRGWVWRNEVFGCIHQNHVFRMRPYSTDMQSELISHHGNTFGQLWFQKAGKQTTNLASINMTILRMFPVPVAPAIEQQAIMELIGEQIESLRSQEHSIELALKQSSAQRQNILRAAFAGKLVPQDPSDESASVLLERIRLQRAQQAKQPKPRKTKKKESNTVARKLVDVLTEAGDWLPAQEAFRRCGIADGAQTEEIEALYAELRVLDKSQRLLVEAITELVVTPEGERKQRKIADRLKMVG